MEWSCRCDIIRLSVADRCTRYVSKEQQLAVVDEEKSRVPEEYLVTTYEYDIIHSCILIGTGTGVILRIFYTGKPKKSKDGNKPGMPLKLVWCLEVRRECVVILRLPPQIIYQGTITPT